jgi:hypothetical protein
MFHTIYKKGNITMKLLNYSEGTFYVVDNLYVPSHTVRYKTTRTTKANGELLKKPTVETVTKTIPAETRTRVLDFKRRSSVKHHGFTDRQIRQARALGSIEV